ncbi:CG30 [Agrotis ipsilon multiple nucleopolyhedrovirus]|uniref:CG30 n=1 Tax=Agrotis ipsilon multiple nucleopolyhedrovirus TaxID=208013 RepID=B6D607_9ABAC|nr:CG30 [Agrotis ipsilon multiple nucleopolyhedrovirus]ACI28794.1 CG30 [Agrotis ipsilon multiple nucleopolyhedrovirus]
MASVTLSCSVCLSDVVIDSSTAPNSIYVVPFVSLGECNHSFCVQCVKGVQIGRQRSVRCPTCRRMCSKLRLISVNENNVLCVEFNATAINRMSTSTLTMNLTMLVESLYPFNVTTTTTTTTTAVNQRSQDLFTPAAYSQQSPSILSTAASSIIDLAQEPPFDSENLPTAAPSQFISNDNLPNNELGASPPIPTPAAPAADDNGNGNGNDDDDIFEARIVAVTELSRLQHEIDALNTENARALDLSTQIERNVAQLNGQVSSLNNEVADLTEQAVTLNHEISIRNDEILHLNNNVSQLNCRISDLNEHVMQLTFDIDAKEAEIDDLNERINIQESIVNNNESKINLLDQQIKDKEDCLAKLNYDLAQEEDKINKLKAKQTKLSNEVKKNIFLEQINKKLFIDLKNMRKDIQDMHTCHDRFIGNISTTINTIKTFSSDSASAIDEPSSSIKPCNETSIATSIAPSTALSIATSSDTAASIDTRDIKTVPNKKPQSTAGLPQRKRKITTAAPDQKPKSTEIELEKKRKITLMNIEEKLRREKAEKAREAKCLLEHRREYYDRKFAHYFKSNTTVPKAKTTVPKE